jgi:hypothetical protein
MADQTIRCADCGGDFVWSEGEQAFYRQNDFTPPKRCKACRAKRKERRAKTPKGPRKNYARR